MFFLFFFGLYPVQKKPQTVRLFLETDGWSLRKSAFIALCCYRPGGLSRILKCYLFLYLLFVIELSQNYETDLNVNLKSGVWSNTEIKSLYRSNPFVSIEIYSMSKGCRSWEQICAPAVPLTTSDIQARIAAFSPATSPWLLWVRKHGTRKTTSLPHESVSVYTRGNGDKKKPVTLSALHLLFP